MVKQINYLSHFKVLYWKFFQFFLYISCAISKQKYQFYCDMSEQVGGFLDANSSFNFNRQKINTYRQNNISPDKFFSWQRDHMYKSTYNTYHGPNTNQPKNTVIPGYCGYIPSVKADSLYGKSRTILAKQCFSSEKLDQNRTGLATTGFNITKEALIDQSKLASSSKYGKTQIQRAHPSWHEQWMTSNQVSYKIPSERANPVYRNSHSVNQKVHIKNSGYSQNHAYLDGNGWKPLPILKAENIASEYRNRFNPQQQYHRETNIVKDRRMKPKQMNYHYNF